VAAAPSSLKQKWLLNHVRPEGDGSPLDDAKKGVESMFGPHRIPYLLKLTDKHCRQAARISGIAT